MGKTSLSLFTVVSGSLNTTTNLRPSPGLASPSVLRSKELLGYVRLARLDLPFYDMHPGRTIEPDAELTLDPTESVVWTHELRLNTYNVLEGVWCEFLQDPRWELKLMERVISLARCRGFTEVEFYEAYCKHVLTSKTTVYGNAQKVMTLFREGRIKQNRLARFQ